MSYEAVAVTEGRPDSDRRDQTSDLSGRSNRFRALRLLALIPGAVVGLLMIWTSGVVTDGGRRFTLFDDSLISMTFARTLAETGELVWYPGADRVEGFTNPGYTLIMTVPHLLGFDQSGASLFMSVLGLGFVLLTAFVCGGLAVRLYPSRLAAVGTVLTVGFSFPLLIWSVFGLEVGLLALLAVTLILAAVQARESGYAARRVWVVAGLGVIGIVVRPDFAVIAITVSLWLVSLSRPSPDPEVGLSRARRAVILIGSVIGTVGLLTLARWFYYGALTPNTYDLKVGNSSLGERLERAFSTSTLTMAASGMLVLGILGIWLLLRTRAADRQLIVLLAAITGVQVLYTFSTGGDVFDPDRFLVPATTIVTVLLISGCASVGSTFSRAWIAGMVAALVLTVTMVNVIPAPWSWVSVVLIGVLLGIVSITSHDPTLRGSRVVSVLAVSAGAALLLSLNAGNPTIGYRAWAQSGVALSQLDRGAPDYARRLAEVTSAEALVASYGAGAPVYWGRLRLVDLLGKIDRTIARQPRRSQFLPGHDKYDYFHSIVDLRPDLIAGDRPGTADSERLLNLFAPTPEESAAVSSRYQRLCMQSGEPVLVRKDTTLVDRSLLQSCP